MRLSRTLRAAAIVAAGLLAAAPASAVTKINGDYQLMLDLRKDQRIFPWDWYTNSNDNDTPARLRIYSVPSSGLEAFFEAEARWSSNDNGAARPEFQYRSAHLRFRREIPGLIGFDSYVFSRQDRFWVDNYLIPFVQGRGSTQGVRIDTWNFLGVNAAFIAADYSDQFNPTNFPAPRDSVAAQAVNRTDDAYVVRVRREFMEDHRLRLGFTFNRFEANTGDSLNHQKNHVAVYGFDSRYRLLGADVSLEYGVSGASNELTVKYPGTRNDVSFFKRSTGIALSKRSVIQAEIRSIRLGAAKTGFLNVTPIWWQRGPLWQNAIGGPKGDETGFAISTIYLLPARAVTYRNDFVWWGNKALTHHDERDVYNELYFEFVNGFTGKAYYRNHWTFSETAGLRYREVYDQWFAELQVESRLAKLVFEVKTINIGRPEEKQLYAVENTVNLTDKVKFYGRFVFGNDASILRKGIFTQLQFRPSGNTEMYLQYGPDYIGGGSVPVDEGNLQGSGDQADIVKFIIRGNF